VKIQKLEKVLELKMQEQLWRFYHEQFTPLNEQTPLSQTLDRPRFNSWLKSSRAIKFIATNDNGEIGGLAIISSELRHDPLISIPYFKKHFYAKRVFHFPVIVVAREFAFKHPRAYVHLMRGMMATIPENGVAIFFHSESENPVIPRLVRKSCAPKINIVNLDSMRCILLKWSAAS
jgi:hypothetical protein